MIVSQLSLGLDECFFVLTLSLKDCACESMKLFLHLFGHKMKSI